MSTMPNRTLKYVLIRYQRALLDYLRHDFLQDLRVVIWANMHAKKQNLWVFNPFMVTVTVNFDNEIEVGISITPCLFWIPSSITFAHWEATKRKGNSLPNLKQYVWEGHNSRADY